MITLGRSRLQVGLSGGDPPNPPAAGEVAHVFGRSWPSWVVPFVPTLFPLLCARSHMPLFLCANPLCSLRSPLRSPFRSPFRSQVRNFLRNRRHPRHQPAPHRAPLPHRRPGHGRLLAHHVPVDEALAHEGTFARAKRARAAQRRTPTPARVEREERAE
jgi:hypothetical protein